MKPHIAYLGGRARAGPAPGAVDGGRGKAVSRTCAPPGPRVPSPQPPAVRSGSLLRRPCSQSQRHSGPARPRPAPPSPRAPRRPARRSRSYKSRLRGRGPGHSEKLCRGDCTARPAGPAPTGVRRLQQPQHRDLGPRAGHGCALGLSAQVGAPGAPRRGRGTGHWGWVREVGCMAWARRFGGCHFEDSNSLEPAGRPGAARGGDASRLGSLVFCLRS